MNEAQWEEARKAARKVVDAQAEWMEYRERNRSRETLLEQNGVLMDTIKRLRDEVAEVVREGDRAFEPLLKECDVTWDDVENWETASDDVLLLIASLRAEIAALRLPHTEQVARMQTNLDGAVAADPSIPYRHVGEDEIYE